MNGCTMTFQSDSYNKLSLIDSAIIDLASKTRMKWRYQRKNVIKQMFVVLLDGLDPIWNPLVWSLIENTIGNLTVYAWYENYFKFYRFLNLSPPVFHLLFQTFRVKRLQNSAKLRKQDMPQC